MSIKNFDEIILSLGDHAIGIAIQHIDIRDFAIVLSVADKEVRDKVMRNMSKLAAAMLKEDLECIGPVNQKDIEEAKMKIISFIRNLVNAGETVIREGDDSQDESVHEVNQDNVKAVIHSIEEACKNKRLYLSSYNTTEEEIKYALAAFENRRGGLAMIQSLSIDSSFLQVIAPLFETDTIHDLTIYGKSNAFQWPSSMEKCHNLTSLEINRCSELTEFPSWIRHADSLRCLNIYGSGITSIPDWIGNLQSLTELSLHNNKSLITLPDSIGNLQSLTELSLHSNESLKTLPDSIGNLQSLTELSLKNNENLKTLPDSIGNLKNLITLDIRNSPVEQLPGSVGNLSALKYVNICRTNIHSVPQSISSVETFIDRVPVEIIPKESISYRGFVNCYYKLAKTALQFSEKARREGLLSLEDEIEIFGDDLFKKGLRLVVDGTDAQIICDLLSLTIEREHDYYRKKLMEIAMEGVLSIQSGHNTIFLLIKLNSMVKIKDNPIDAAYMEYLVNREYAFSNIDFKSAIQPEEEREEARFIKRAVALSEKARREGLLALESQIDNEGIANRDVFEYGLSMIGCNSKIVDDVLTRLISHETDPVQKNIAMAKKEAVLLIFDGYNTRILALKLLAYFDKSIAKTLEKELFKD